MIESEVPIGRKMPRCGASTNLSVLSSWTRVYSQTVPCCRALQTRCAKLPILPSMYTKLTSVTLVPRGTTLIGAKSHLATAVVAKPICVMRSFHWRQGLGFYSPFRTTLVEIPLVSGAWFSCSIMLDGCPLSLSCVLNTYTILLDRKSVV